MTDPRSVAIATLVEHYKPRDFSAAQIRIYEKALQTVPEALLEPMAYRVIATCEGYGKVPEVKKLLEAAEYVRLELVKAHKFEPCVQCEDMPGWVKAPEQGNAIRWHTITRCQCWKAHREKLARLGVGSQPVALPEKTDVATD